MKLGKKIGLIMLGIIICLIFYTSYEILLHVHVKGVGMENKEEKMIAWNSEHVVQENISKKSDELFFFQSPLHVFYDEKTHVLYVDKALGSYEVRIGETNIEKCITLNGAYLAYFLPFEIHDFIVVTTKNGERYTFSLGTVEKFNEEIDEFINEKGYFIRVDLSYICSTELRKRLDGQCHDDSYFIA